MAKLTKRMQAIQAKVKPGKLYTLDEALALLKECPSAKFAESVDVAVNLGIDPRKSDQVVPGAAVVGFEDLAEQVKAGNLNFDLVIASPDAMRIVGQLGQILGPRGLMPNPKVGTVTPDVAGAVKNAKAGQVRYRADKAGIVHCAIGKVNFEVPALRENLQALMAGLMKAKPATAKGVYVKKITLSSTMGPGIPVDTSSLAQQPA